MTKQAVVFVTHAFAEVKEGPAIYARYLFDYFSDHEAIDFHLVVPVSEDVHPRIHVAGSGTGSLDSYTRLQDKGLEVAASLGNPIVHGNYAHGMWKFRNYKGCLFLQVNDYDPAEIYSNTKAYLRDGLYRRYLSLVWRRFNERRAVISADRVLCNSKYTSRAVMQSYKLANKRCEVVYKAVDLSCFTPATPPLASASGNPFRLVFVGSNWRRKGLSDLLLVVHRLLGQGCRVELDIVGPDKQELMVALREVIERDNLNKHLIFSGKVDREQLAGHYKAADLCVLPSYYEALGVALLEAMASGVPVVSTNIGGIPEVIGNSGAGILLAPGDITAMLETIGRLMADKQSLERMREAGIRRAKDFSVEKMCGAIERLYLVHADFGNGLNEICEGGT